MAYGMCVKNGTTEAYYYYLFNAQGDIVGIIDVNGIQVVEYTYDAWGNILSVTGSLAGTIGQKNPLRYRGYYYDSETGFYYLLSRYYDPGIGRFINADGVIAGIGGNVLGYNMFAYCMNNPVNMIDSNGNFGEFLKKMGSRLVHGVQSLARMVASTIEAITVHRAVGLGVGGEVNLGDVSVSAGWTVSEVEECDVDGIHRENISKVGFSLECLEYIEVPLEMGYEHSYEDESCTCEIFDSYYDKLNCEATEEFHDDSSIGFSIGAYALIGGEIGVSIDLKKWTDDLIIILYDSLEYSD